MKERAEEDHEAGYENSDSDHSLEEHNDSNRYDYQREIITPVHIFKVRNMERDYKRRNIRTATDLKRTK